MARVIQVCRHVCSSSDIAPYDDMLDHGVDPFETLAIAARLQDLVAFPLSLPTVFECTTPRQLQTNSPSWQ
ncbi:acyl carrier protein [Streptomyces sp. NPDC099088]|uniref:acyl carrier protein n=1 Tax=Streptomyces sp. NPDC099088 TaxID=3366101 RepID=UPI0038225C4C